MLRLIQIQKEQNDLWDKFVWSHPAGWLTALSSWEKVLKEVSPYVKSLKLALIDEEKQQIKAGLPLYMIKTPLAKRRLVSVPLATISDPIISSEDELKCLLKASFDLMARTGSSNVQIKANQTKDFFGKTSLVRAKVWKYHLISLDDKIDSIWKKFDRSSIRKTIRKAERHNLQFRPLVDKHDLKIFHQLYTDTRRRLGLPALPFEFFNRIYTEYGSSQNVYFLFAQYKGLDIASLMLLRFQNRFSAEALGWNYDFSRLSPSVFLYWKAIQLAHSAGAQSFDLGRTDPRNSGLLHFKRKWGGQEKEIAEFRLAPKASRWLAELIQSTKLMEGVKLVSATITPSWAFKAISKLFYRFYLE
jgi:CelD/BcsL family acetyltransferase involved in cellulose biosynthesis